MVEHVGEHQDCEVEGWELERGRKVRYVFGRGELHVRSDADR